MNIDDLLRIAMERRASDLHLKVGNYPHLRIDGDLVPLTDQARVSARRHAEHGVQHDVGSAKAKIQRDHGNRHGLWRRGPGTLPCERISAARQCGAGAARHSDEDPRAGRTVSAESGGADLRYAARPGAGDGGDGSGKSTTLAAMVDRINSTRAEHIITIEDPIEFLHRDKKGYVNQREVEVDTPSFSAALRASLRQDPDVILVGEMRDLETIGTALHAAETGHMVFSTLHTLDAVESINRIIAIFPPPEQKQIRLQLAAVLRAIVSQRLVRRSDTEGRVPAVEVMVTTAYIRECILVPEKTRAIREAISAGTSQYGMQTFDQSLWDLFQAGLVITKRLWRAPRTRMNSSCACRALRPRRIFRGNRCSRRGLDAEVGMEIGFVLLKAVASEICSS